MLKILLIFQKSQYNKLAIF